MKINDSNLKWNLLKTLGTILWGVVCINRKYFLSIFKTISCSPHRNINIQTSNLYSSEWSNLNRKMSWWMDWWLKVKPFRIFLQLWKKWSPIMYPSPKSISVVDAMVVTWFGKIFIKIETIEPQQAASAKPQIHLKNLNFESTIWQIKGQCLKWYRLLLYNKTFNLFQNLRNNPFWVSKLGEIVCKKCILKNCLGCCNC